MLYSKKINEYSKWKSNNIIIPDLYLKKEGVACGDYFSISGEVDDNILSFCFTSNDACMLCKASCGCLNKNYNNMDIIEVKQKIDCLHSNIMNNHLKIFQLFDIDSKKYAHRFDCLFSPIKLLKTFIDQLTENTSIFINKGRINTKENLECDACVSACEINWNNRLLNSFKKNTDYANILPQKWLRFAKIWLNDEEKEQLKNISNHITAEEYQFLSDRTINTFVLKNIISINPSLAGRQWKPAAYLVQKNEITKQYISKIEKMIKDNGWELYFVKGHFTQQFYDAPSSRIHSDYDVVSTNGEDAFNFASELLRMGFRIRPHLFSIKKMGNEKKYTYSGHMHMQKVIDDTYMLEIDISFPGFLLNRVELFYAEYHKQKICVEDQIIITLLHLFKHSHVFMKDINDLYLMLSKANINIDKLAKRIHQYGLKDYFNLTFNYISNNYPLDEKKCEEYTNALNLNPDFNTQYYEWPYNEEMHIQIKKSDYLERNKNSEDNERIFLFPVLIFSNSDDTYLERIQQKYNTKTLINNSIYEIKLDHFSIYYTKLGLFIDNNIDVNTCNRKMVTQDIQSFLNTISIKEYADVPFSTESFYVRTI